MHSHEWASVLYSTLQQASSANYTVLDRCSKQYIGMSVQSSLLGTSLHTASLSRSAKRCAKQRTCCFKASDTGIQSQQTGAHDQLPVESTRYEP